MKRIVIIGGGPTGLGADWRLQESNYANWTLYEINGVAGGHAASHRDPQGYMWDEGARAAKSRRGRTCVSVSAAEHISQYYENIINGELDIFVSSLVTLYEFKSSSGAGSEGRAG